MSDRDAGSEPVPSLSPTVEVGLVSVAVAASLGVVLVGPPPGEFGPAGATVGFVLAEAVVLYVGYGALTRVTDPLVRDLLERTWPRTTSTLQSRRSPFSSGSVC